MSVPEQKGLVQPGRRIVVWMTEHRGKLYRYVQLTDGGLVPYGRYLSGELEKDELREQKRVQSREDAVLKRWARMWQAHKVINGNGHGG